MVASVLPFDCQCWAVPYVTHSHTHTHAHAHAHAHTQPTYMHNMIFFLSRSSISSNDRQLAAETPEWNGGPGPNRNGAPAGARRSDKKTWCGLVHVWFAIGDA